MLLIRGPRANGRYLCSIDKLSSQSFSIFSVLLQLPTSSSVSQIIQELCSAVFFFFFLLLSLPSSVLQWHHEGGNFFSEYDIQLAFLRRILFISVLFSPIRSRICSLVTFYDHFIFFHSPPPPHFKSLQILLLQFSQCPGL